MSLARGLFLVGRGVTVYGMRVQLLVGAVATVAMPETLATPGMAVAVAMAVVTTPAMAVEVLVGVATGKEHVLVVTAAKTRRTVPVRAPVAGAAVLVIRQEREVHPALLVDLAQGVA